MYTKLYNSNIFAVVNPLLIHCGCFVFIVTVVSFVSIAVVSYPHLALLLLRCVFAAVVCGYFFKW